MTVSFHRHIRVAWYLLEATARAITTFIITTIHHGQKSIHEDERIFQNQPSRYLRCSSICYPGILRTPPSWENALLISHRNDHLIMTARSEVKHDLDRLVIRLGTTLDSWCCSFVNLLWVSSFFSRKWPLFNTVPVIHGQSWHYPCRLG